MDVIREILATVLLMAGQAVFPLAADGPAPPPPTPTATPTAVPTATPVPPTATPQPVRVSGTLTRSEVIYYARLAGFPEWSLGTVAAVAWCESSYYTGAVGKLGERGLMQIHPVHPEWSRAFDPLVNMQAAYRISNGGTNWSPWPNCP